MDDYQLEEILLDDLESDRVERKASNNPRQFIPGAYIQFLRIDGTELTDPIKDQKEIDGPLPEQLQLLDEILEANISTATDITKQAREFSTQTIR